MSNLVQEDLPITRDPEVAVFPYASQAESSAGNPAISEDKLQHSNGIRAKTTDGTEAASGLDKCMDDAQCR